MARLICDFLVILLAYHFADVVNGAADANSLPPFVTQKDRVFEKLKGVCYSQYSTKVIAHVNLPGCRVTCARGVFNGFFGSGSTVSLRDDEPCDYNGICQRGQCVYTA
uniref:Putative ixodes 8-cys protein n=1 Tax=Ixodes ricinus TaxID=34613 RepID=A0A0K8R2P4_IXORI